LSADALAAFRLLVAADKELQLELLATEGHAHFVALVMRRAEAAGYPVNPEDIEAGLRAGRRERLERWL